MVQPLTQTQQDTVDRLMTTLSTKEKIAQLLCPDKLPKTDDELEALAKEVPLGAFFLHGKSKEDINRVVRVFKKYTDIPLLIAADLEHGPYAGVKEGTQFPFVMGAGAANDADLVRRMGDAAAREGRAHGFNWTFGPVVDLNINPENPVTNIRAFGEDPDHVMTLACAFIEGVQADGRMATAAKHFPGDGLDDRDQHFATSINPLSKEEWDKTYGRVWKRVIDEGTMSIMVGHIGFPAVDPGVDYKGATPGTLSSKIQIDLLKNELGFKGVIVSDALPMIGMQGHVRCDEAAVMNVITGSDSVLFADPIPDFAELVKAYEEGRLTDERVDDGCRRILEMKARVGLFDDTAIDVSFDKSANEKNAGRMADASITLIRDATNLYSLKKEECKNVLTVTLMYDEGKGDRFNDLAVVDDELRARGCTVTHLVNPSHYDLLTQVNAFDTVFLNIKVWPHCLMGTTRLTGKLGMALWRAFWTEHDRVLFTSFGSPYHLKEIPAAPNMVTVYGDAHASQRAAVKAWFGEIPFNGKSPVTLEGFFKREV